MGPETRFGKIAGALVTVITVVGGILGIASYIGSRPLYDLSGPWIIATTIAHTSCKPFQDGQATYRVAFTQDGMGLQGYGEKWTEFGKPISGRGHTPLKIVGTLDGETVHATFTEEGTERKSSGSFEWKVSKDKNRWEGTFESTAADSSGPSVLSRDSP